jgi:hypothetical protein
MDSFSISFSGVLSNWCFKSAYVHHNNPVPTKREVLLKIKFNKASSQDTNSFKRETNKTLFLHPSLNVYLLYVKSIGYVVSNKKWQDNYTPIPVGKRSKAWVCSCSPAGIVGSNPAGGMDVCLL